MYPGTIVNWHDESYIQVPEVQSADNTPLFLTVSSFDMGPEDLRVVRGQEFYDLYGTDNTFKKHGQPAIQAANIINNGGALLVKRIVASDATLANLILTANVKATSNIVESNTDPNAKTKEEIMGASVVTVDSVDELPVDGSEDIKYFVRTANTEGEETTYTFKEYIWDESTSEFTEGADTTVYSVYPNTTISWGVSSVADAQYIEDIQEAIEDGETVDPEEVGEVSLYIRANGTAVVVTKNEDENYVDASGNIVYTDEGEKLTDSDITTATSVESSFSQPMCIVTDNGRGEISKAIRFIPDYATSKNSKNFFYNIRVFNGTSAIENNMCTFAENVVTNGINYSLNPNITNQVKIVPIDGAFTAYQQFIADSLGVEFDKLNNYDLISGKTNKNAMIPGITIDPESIDLNTRYGVVLSNGSNGSFGDKPFGTQDYIDAATWAFYPVIVDEYDAEKSEMRDKYDYKGSDKIFDLDEFHIAACFDANYPDKVKDAIAQLASFREDFFFFRDFGLDIASYSSIVDKLSGYPSYGTGDKFIGNYITTYQIYDPADRKRIRVTMMYDFAAKAVAHFINGPYRPLAGFVNSMILDSAIEGTVNFTPRITPAVNQKALLEDLRVNYAIFQDGQCVVQSLYTSQEPYTQLSYINNVLAIQQVVRAVRIACPKFRYTFINGTDFSYYAEKVTDVLSSFTANFAELGFNYEQDVLRGMQKIFYATITFRFNNWAQTEVFDLYALPNIE